jgi:exodeoxyribonuclease VIII
MEPGIYKDISNEDYHRGPGLSASGLKLLAQSPSHFKGSVREETPAMRIGTALHTAVLEPDRFADEYVAAPDIDRRTKAGKEAWAELEQSGKLVLSAKEYGDACGMAEAIRRHSIAVSLVSGGMAERSVYWECTAVVADAVGEEEVPFLCKARPDYIRPLSKGHLVVDLKTTPDARDFERSAYSLGYHLQAAHYRSGLNSTPYGAPKSFVFVVVEKTPPYGVMVYDASQEFLNRGHDENTALYSLYAKCLKTGSWPGYEEKIQILSLPKWAA